MSPDFDRGRFLALALDGFDDLELTPRARQIANALAETLPVDREAALGIIVDSLGPEIEEAELTGMASFLYLPHVFFVADHCHPQTIDVVKTRAVPLGVEVVVGDAATFSFDENSVDYTSVRFASLDVRYVLTDLETSLAHVPGVVVSVLQHSHEIRVLCRWVGV